MDGTKLDLSSDLLDLLDLSSDAGDGINKVYNIMFNLENQLSVCFDLA